MIEWTYYTQMPQIRRLLAVTVDNVQEVADLIAVNAPGSDPRVQDGRLVWATPWGDESAGPGDNVEEGVNSYTGQARYHPVVALDGYQLAAGPDALYVTENP